jgi:hypothetical protein
MAAAVDEAAGMRGKGRCRGRGPGTAELSPPWPLLLDSGEGSLPWTRPQDGGGVAAADEAVGTKGRVRRRGGGSGTAELSPP